MELGECRICGEIVYNEDICVYCEEDKKQEKIKKKKEREDK